MAAENPNPFQALIQTVERFSNCVQTHLANFSQRTHLSLPTKKNPLISLSSSINADSTATTTLLLVKKSAAPVTKKELGRATWTFLHTLAAQVEEMNSLVAKLASETMKERVLLEQYKDVLYTLAAILVQDCSLRTYNTTKSCIHYQKPDNSCRTDLILTTHPKC